MGETVSNISRKSLFFVWRGYDAAKKVKTAIQESPEKSAEKVGGFVYGQAKNIGGVAMGLANILWQPVPYSAHAAVGAAKTFVNKGVALSAGPLKTAPDSLFSLSNKQALQTAKQEAESKCRWLQENPPQIEFNAPQYALHAGCMLPVKAAKLMCLAAIVHATGLYHTAFGGILVPGGEAHVLAAAGLHPASEAALGVGVVGAVHGPFEKTLRNSNILQFRQERLEYNRQMKQAANDLRQFSLALAAFEGAGAAADPAVAKMVDRALQRAEVLAKAKANKQASQQTPPSVDDAATEIATPTALDSTKWAESTPAQRATNGSVWRNISAVYTNAARQNRQLATKQGLKVTELEKKMEYLQSPQATANAAEKAKLQHRIDKVKVKQNLARQRARKNEILRDLRFAAKDDAALERRQGRKDEMDKMLRDFAAEYRSEPPDLQRSSSHSISMEVEEDGKSITRTVSSPDDKGDTWAHLHAEYLTVEDEINKQTLAYAQYKAAQEWSSPYIQAAVPRNQDIPVLFAAVRTAVRYTSTVFPPFAAVYFSVLAGRSKLQRHRLAKAMEQANAADPTSTPSPT